MSDEAENGPGQHPVESLAAYVDGSASPQERRTVESHLPACDGCRREVDLARSAMAALRALPEVDPPELAVPGAVRAPAPIPIRAGGRSGTWRRATWALAGAAAAAALVALFLGVGGHLGGGVSSPAAGGAGLGAVAAPSPAQGPTLIHTNANYTATQLAALAVGAANAKAPEAGASPGRFQALSPGRSSAAAPALIQAAVDCAFRAAGSQAGAQILRLEVARYLGKPADVAIMIVGSGASRRGLAVAADPLTCRPLQIVTRAAAAG